MQNANTGFIDLRDKCYTSRKQNFITKIVNAPCKVFNFESLEEEYYFDELDEEMEKLPGYHILTFRYRSMQILQDQELWRAAKQCIMGW